MPSRRTTLKALGIGASTLLLPRKSQAARFGDASGRTGLPDKRRVKSVLEIYCYGGLCPWESFYFVPDRGKREQKFYYAFDSGENKNALSACGVTAANTLPFARDARGVDVRLGPFARALFARKDMVQRTRVVVQRHNLLPHEAAVPYGITGKFVGSPALSSLAAHVQQARTEVGKREVPYSYVLMNAMGAPSDNIDAFMATGSHPGTARPLRLNIDDATRLTTLLSRPSVSDHGAAYDAYLAARVAAFRDRLKFDGQGEFLRSKATAEIDSSVRAVAHSAAVGNLLPQELLTTPKTQFCGQKSFNYPLTSLKLATYLLKHPKTPAGYVCVLDTGFVPASGGGGYDTHAANEQIVQMTNLENLLQGLADAINPPGKYDPNKLDLDETLIIINTEFGRTPQLQAEQGGRNHHPDGYCTVFMGGPVEGHSICGAIDDKGEATEFATPAENRIAALLSMGIYPFSADAFSLAEVQGAKTEPEAVRLALQRVLGVRL